MVGKGGLGCSRADCKGPTHKYGWVLRWQEGAVLTQRPKAGLSGLLTAAARDSIRRYFKHTQAQPCSPRQPQAHN